MMMQIITKYFILTTCLLSLAADYEEESRDVTDDHDDPDSYRDRIYLIDFGLASKYVDANGAHRPFFMDERRAHDGTLEFTSRDAHLGAHSRRSDLECLGYNLVYWSQGELAWKNDKRILQNPEEVHHMKEFFMSDAKEMMKLCYGAQVPKYLGVFLDYVNKLMYTDPPDYDYCRSIFRKEFKRLGYSLDTDFHVTFDKPLLVNGKVATPRKPKPLAVADQVDSPNIVARLGNSNKIKGDPLLMKFGLLVPSIRDSSANKLSPKNLRSKKETPNRTGRSRSKRLSLEELLATDPEQIARQRIEKEFDGQDSDLLEVSIRYQGKPTYAILELESKLNGTLNRTELDATVMNDSLGVAGLNDSFLEVTPIKGYTKPMMDLVRRRHSNLMRSLIESNKDTDGANGGEASSASNRTDGLECESPLRGLQLTTPQSRRRKAGLRQYVKPTPKSLFYHKSLLNKKLMETRRVIA